MFPLVLGQIRTLLALAALGATSFTRPAAASAQDEWRPRTVPLLGASYSPDLGLLIGVGVAHTRYGFRALPPSTRLLASAELSTGAGSYRAAVEGQFRRPLAPGILSIELRASGLEILRFYGFGNETDASQPDSVYRVRQKQLVLAPEVSARLAARLRLGVGPLVKYTHTYSDTGTILTRTGPYYGAGNFGQVGTRAELELDTRDMPVAPARGAHLRVAAEWYPAAWDVIDPLGSVSAEASTYASAGDTPAATLALRVGGAAASGTVPFSEWCTSAGKRPSAAMPSSASPGARGRTRTPNCGYGSGGSPSAITGYSGSRTRVGSGSQTRRRTAGTPLQAVVSGSAGSTAAPTRSRLRRRKVPRPRRSTCARDSCSEANGDFSATR